MAHDDRRASVTFEGYTVMMRLSDPETEGAAVWQIFLSAGVPRRSDEDDDTH